MAIFNKKKKKILYVDDSEVDLDLVENMLQDFYTVLPSKSGQEALDFLLRNDSINLILLDLIMPEMDGFETFSRIKDLGTMSHIPIAFLTSSKEENDQAQAEKLGAADYILKPYTQKELLTRIKNIIGN